MLVQVFTVDADHIWVNTLQVAACKLHPTVSRPEMGLVILSGGKELFLTLQSYHDLIERMQDATATEARR